MLASAVRQTLCEWEAYVMDPKFVNPPDGQTVEWGSRKDF